MESAEHTRRYTIDDLPAFSIWPARLLGTEPWSPRQKTESEVLREFECEKWSALLARMNRIPGKVTVDDVDSWTLEGLPDSLSSVGDRFELASPLSARRRYNLMIASVLRRYLPASALVELGAGYGSVILQVAREPEFEGLPLFAGEYTPSGVELLRRLSAADGVGLTAGRCDLASSQVVDFAVPNGSVVFTSMAAMYIPMLSEAYVRGIVALRPRVVVNVEPCYEHWDCTTLTGMLRRRYTEINDYNRNLVSLLHQQESAGRVRILEEMVAVFGPNPLLPASVVAWTPVS